MTTSLPPHSTGDEERSRFWELVFTKVPGARFITNLNIGPKLTLGFGVLMVLLGLVLVLSTIGNRQATAKINRADDELVPIVLASSRAQASLLRMESSTRGYLALGDPDFIVDYRRHQAAFETNLAELKARAGDINDLNRDRLAQLDETYQEWLELPEPLFVLRDDQLEREPAYQLLATEGVQTGGQAIIDTDKLIEAQAIRPATRQNIELLKDMANFQSSLATMLSGLRNYVTTQNRIYRQEYEVSLTKNEIAWEQLLTKRDNGLLADSQVALLDEIEVNRDAFLELPPRIFPILESDQVRQDLYLFRREAVPRAALMMDLLNDLTIYQQEVLSQELNRGRSDLARATNTTLVFGVVALLAAVFMSFSLRENIAGPVRRLTRVAERIREGDLGAQAQVESSDEIGLLAQTFNRMTTRLRETLLQVSKEKKRASDLLNVVIPIGVELSSEKDFNRLLEKMLLEAKAFCYADAGTLYLRTEDDHLRYVIVRNNTQRIALGGTTEKDVSFPPIPLYDEAGEPNQDHVAAHVALTGGVINIANIHRSTEFDFSGPRKFDAETGYRTVSMLTIPLKGSQSENVLGVLQLINAQEPETGEIIPFDANLQEMMESFSLLAVAALEAYIREQQLRQEIQQLRIEIDEAKLQQQVTETVSTDFFQDLQEKARSIRRRRRRRRTEPTEEQE